MSSFIDDMREALSRFPCDMTIGAFLDLLPAPAKARCRHCRQPIESYGGSYWRHGDPDHSRGCRTASYRTGQGWDDSIPERTYAAPERQPA